MRKTKLEIMRNTLNPVQFIEWLHLTKAYKPELQKRKNYSKTFNNSNYIISYNKKRKRT